MKYITLLLGLALTVSLVLILRLVPEAEAAWILYRKSTGEYLGNTGIAKAGGKPWKPPKNEVIERKTWHNWNYYVPVEDIDAFWIEDTDEAMKKLGNEKRYVPKINFDAAKKPISITFKEDAQVARQQLIQEIEFLDKEIANLESLETKHGLNLAPEKTEKNAQIQKLKQELNALQ